MRLIPSPKKHLLPRPAYHSLISNTLTLVNSQRGLGLGVSYNNRFSIRRHYDDIWLYFLFAHGRPTTIFSLH